jgi:hypothetical protein
MKFNRTHTLLIGTVSMILIVCSGSAQAYDAEFDYNNDGRVDTKDSELIKAAFNTGEGDQEFNSIFDHDGDGFITMADISLAFGAAANGQ